MGQSVILASNIDFFDCATVIQQNQGVVFWSHTRIHKDVSVGDEVFIYFTNQPKNPDVQQKD